ncbi:MAG: adenosine kinase [Rhodobacteraceae bacterium]|jgi:sugar/nucleoside kinase (ribokinase family)|uniref:Sugar kinase, ribokinase n=1 Tax=Salipiger profundus TaxID=1229727 RepID=A0A1U7D2P6_9RHOB|nr:MULTISPECIES: adenosine kinase [Salipiger]APX22437.1 sugar kinase, ribokinase [Salipiger profundus]MAB06577.1 adenosine kinase [Paracoccaceae bacterium]GGA26683.1 adenosine kinase [Salipiger profundus]SFD86675.1 Sugar or nucleoside kinase, ribokinase family [Salipiger profundus]
MTLNPQHATKKYQVVGIGNAIVDVLTRCDDSFLDHMGIEKGIMQLVERDRSEQLFGAMSDRVQAPGGSVANTIAGIGGLGLRTGFIGRVHDDALGQFYAEAMEKGGTDFVNPPVPGGELPTSRCMIFVSPDGERSMNTYLGISAELGPEDVSDDVAHQAEIVFLEGYLFDKPKGKDAFTRMARSCRAAGGMAGIAISDPFCVERHRDDFVKLIANEMDYVIGNEAEIRSLFQDDNLDKDLARVAELCPLVVCTRSGDGVSIIHEGTRIDIPVTKIVPVDATGAGDQFAAGFLFGLATGADMETAGRMGTVAATEVIGHMGPRPEADLKALFRRNGLL